MTPATVPRGRDLFVYRCVDEAGAAEKRAALLADHLAYVEAHFASYAVAGPMLDPSGAMVGSLFVLDAPDQAAADAIMAGDPYWAGGIYGAVETGVFRAAAGGWIGGKIW